MYPALQMPPRTRHSLRKFGCDSQHIASRSLDYAREICTKGTECTRGNERGVQAKWESRP